MRQTGPVTRSDAFLPAPAREVFGLSCVGGVLASIHRDGRNCAAAYTVRSPACHADIAAGVGPAGVTRPRALGTFEVIVSLVKKLRVLSTLPSDCGFVGWWI